MLLLVKDGSPTVRELDELSRKIGAQWRLLGHQLHLDESELNIFQKEHEALADKAFYMLVEWARRHGTYQVLTEALSHKTVNRQDLAEQFYQWDTGASTFSIIFHRSFYITYLLTSDCFAKTGLS